ncbi:MAG TPA: SDR family oxidoreductase [Trebonia sp.]|nr:SDR family oxidoreductase [Trebonia sp.]
MGAGTRIEPGDRVVITGASGFIGSAVARALRERGACIVAIVEPGADRRNLDAMDAERVVADVRDAAAIRAACTGARFVFHLAAIYRFWARDPRVFYDVNVGGTLNVLGAARAAGCERLVYTSTVGVLAVGTAPDAPPSDETCYADLAHLAGPYKRSKFVAEHEVLRACAEGLDVCIALPTFPLGPGDVGPTPTGKVVLDFLNGRMPGFVDTAMNVAHVDDLALGHVAALEHGARGRSYILGGENMTMRAILHTLAGCSGLPMPRLRVPGGLAVTAGAASSLVQGRLLRREPWVPLEGARMSATQMIFSDERSRAEIGYTSRPAREAIGESARWFAGNGYVSARRLAAIKWREARLRVVLGQVKHDGDHDGQRPQQDRGLEGAELDRVVVRGGECLLERAGERLAYLREGRHARPLDLEPGDGQVTDGRADLAPLGIDQGVVTATAADADLAEQGAVRIGQLGDPLAAHEVKGEHVLPGRGGDREYSRVRDELGDLVEHRAALGLPRRGEQVPLAIEDLEARPAGKDLPRLPDPQFLEVEEVIHVLRLCGVSRS